MEQDTLFKQWEDGVSLGSAWWVYADEAEKKRFRDLQQAASPDDALKDAQRITKSTPAISARQFETKRARELFGVTPEKATQARRHGAISYVSADQRERVAKAAITREENNVIAAIKKLRSSGEAVPSNSPDKRRHGTSHPISEHAEGRYRAIRRRKLAGEHIPDGEWQWFIDHARRLKDPQYELLRGSPAAFGFALTA
jgi:hypothetical protein